MRTQLDMAFPGKLRAEIEALAGTSIDAIPARRRVEFAHQIAQRDAASSPNYDLRLPEKNDARHKRQLTKLQTQLSGYRSIVNDLPASMRLEARSRISRLEERIQLLGGAA